MLIVGYVTARFDGGVCRPIFEFTFPSASASGEKSIRNSSLNHPTFVVVTIAGDAIAVQVRPVPYPWTLVTRVLPPKAGGGRLVDAGMSSDWLLKIHEIW